MMPSFPRIGRSWGCRPLSSHTVSSYHMQKTTLGMWAYSFPQQMGSPYNGSCLNLNIKMMVNKELRPYYSKPWIYLKFNFSGCNRHGFFCLFVCLLTPNSRLLPRDMKKSDRMGKWKGHSKEVRGRTLFNAIILWERISCTTFFSEPDLRLQAICLQAYTKQKVAEMYSNIAKPQACVCLF